MMPPLNDLLVTVALFLLTYLLAGLCVIVALKALILALRFALGVADRRIP